MRQLIVERLKKTATVWLAVYPSVLVATLFIGDALQNWPLPLRVLGATMVIVPIVANIAEPGVRHALAAIGRAGVRRRTKSSP